MLCWLWERGLRNTSTAGCCAIYMRDDYMPATNCDLNHYLECGLSGTAPQIKVCSCVFAENVNLPLLNGLRLDNSSFNCIMWSGGVARVDHRPAPYRRFVPGLWKALLPTEASEARSKQSASEGVGKPLLESDRPDRSIIPVDVVLPRQAAEAVWGSVMSRCRRIGLRPLPFCFRGWACQAGDWRILT